MKAIHITETLIIRRIRGGKKRRIVLKMVQAIEVPSTPFVLGVHSNYL
jgi:hypothetical protein